MKSQAFLTYTRNFIFGAEDSIVSTVGLLTGIAAGGLSRHDIILTGMTLVLVEAFSMGVGSYLSEYATEESYMKESKASKESTIASMIMFVSYTLTGLIPLAPFILIQDGRYATISSIVLSLIALFLLGMISSKILSIKLLKISIRMATLGGIAILIGLVIGNLAK